MTDKFSTLKTAYDHNVPADALFFKNKIGSIVHKAFRLEVPNLGKEFTDNAYIGKDPEGTFYYNTTTPLVPTTTANPNNFIISRIINPFDNKTLAWIRFYHEKPENCYAEFLAYDPEETVTGSELDGYTAVGDWNPLSLGSTTAKVLKYADSTTMTLTAESVNLVATIKDVNNYLKNTEVTVSGNLFFKTSKDLPKGIYASYNDDRIVFYENDYTGKDFVAYFIPHEGLPTELGITAVNTKTFENVSWAGFAVQHP